MGFLFSNNKKEKTLAIFDIGSGSVGGAIVKIPFDETKIPYIIKTVRTDIKPRGDLTFDGFMNNMIVALNKTASSLYQEKLGAPDEIVCVLASPWYISETRVIKVEQDKQFLFNRKLANELIQKEVKNLEILYKEKYGESEGKPEIIEQHTMSISLNGYPVKDPLGRRCKLLEMNMVISLAPVGCLNKIKEVLSKTFHNSKVSFSTFTVSTFFAVRDKYISPSSYLLLDISGEVTDVGIVTKGVLRSVLSFPFGKKTFYKYICTKLEIELRDAEELFKLYIENNLSSEFKKKVDPLFKSIENSWGEAFRACIDTLPRTLILPATIFLTADNDIKKWFSDVLQNEEHIQEMVQDHKCNVVTLEGPQFLSMCQIKEGACDPFLMIESIAVMRKIIK